jgi:hypothetical protein
VEATSNRSRERAQGHLSRRSPAYSAGAGNVALFVLSSYCELLDGTVISLGDAAWETDTASTFNATNIRVLPSAICATAATKEEILIFIGYMGPASRRKSILVAKATNNTNSASDAAIRVEVPGRIGSYPR